MYYMYIHRDRQRGGKKKKRKENKTTEDRKTEEVLNTQNTVQTKDLQNKHLLMKG